LVVDESHMTIPQIRGMYRGDQSRKANLVNYGFRLKAAFDNRPLQFNEYSEKVKQTIYVSATPAEWEVKISGQVVEQLIRPTGIPDPKIFIRPVENQLPDLIAEIEKRAAKKQRVLVTTLTKRIAEDLTVYLKEKGIKASYLHSDIKTLERSDILDSLRKGSFSVLIGINLLREGLDLPEVTLVAILDADKEGFLRSKTALIQTMGRAARNVEGEVIIYTDKITKSIQGAIKEVSRRRARQIEYNKANNIVPKTIIKPIREKVIISDQEDLKNYFSVKTRNYRSVEIDDILPSSLTKYDKAKIIKQLRRQMKKEAENLNFEFAAIIRDKIKQLDKDSI
jgi:excinuclease ABC subunit B